MKNLSQNQLSQVNGGYGTGPDGIFSETNLASAGRFARGLGYVGGAFSVGWAIGSWLNDNTGIQDFIARQLP